MSHRLLIPRIDIFKESPNALPTAVNIAVTRGAENAPRSQVAIECKEAFDIHM
jgi:hypothetical protein